MCTCRGRLLATASIFVSLTVLSYRHGGKLILLSQLAANTSSRDIPVDSETGCEWADLFQIEGLSMPHNGSGSVVYEHVFRLSVWSSQTEPELVKMRTDFPATSEAALKRASIAALCKRCAPFMPITNNDKLNLHRRIVRGIASCIRKYETSILSNITQDLAIHGMPEPHSPCRNSVVSGQILVERNGLKLGDSVLGPHQNEVECAAEIPLVPSLKVPMVFSAARDLKTHCSVPTNMSKWHPWCRGLQHLLETQDQTVLTDGWVQKLVEAGVLHSQEAHASIVRPTALALDQDDATYFGLFRLRDAAFSDGDLVSRCTQGTFPECFYAKDKASNQFYSSAWHSLPDWNRELRAWYTTVIDDPVPDATYVCCAESKKSAAEAESEGCSKFVLASTCPLLTEQDRQAHFVRTFETCLRAKLSNSSETSAWSVAALSRHISGCCRADYSRLQMTERRMPLRALGNQKMCLETTCPPTPKVFTSVFHTWHMWDGHYFHATFEGIPSVLAWRNFLRVRNDTLIRSGSVSVSVGQAGQKILDAIGLRSDRVLLLPRTKKQYLVRESGFARELLLARSMPATSAMLPHPQLLVPFRAVFCTSALQDPDVGVLQRTTTYRSVWELALTNPDGCAEFKSEKSPALCYSSPASAFLNDSDEGVLKVLLAEHGPGLSARRWNEGKSFVHEAVRLLPTLLPRHLQPRAVLVADVQIGLFPVEAQRRSFAEAHVVIGVMGSQLANAVCMQPGSFLGVIQPCFSTDPFLWNLAASFGVQYWALVANAPPMCHQKYNSDMRFTAEDNASLNIFIETALVGASAMLVH
eukprot:TRINITY_DN9541_c0_g1_i1.p1 TRINITY_DN9541_c0_g1~~TRINITY_DN9541_c0_g1_i1.p1  ORF type:complete len:822 (+),score=73.73 TRINITY_DN9541_c0_g1_i1:33-2468(+)